MIGGRWCAAGRLYRRLGARPIEIVMKKLADI
jgi:hypothetical protein